MSDQLTALRLQIAWGADEALGDMPLDRFTPAPTRPSLVARTQAPAIPAAPPVADQPPATTLDELFTQWDASTASALRATATHTVRPDGNPCAGIVVIGDAPGSDDDRSGRAFSGAQGQVLDRVMGSAGLDRTAMLLTTLSPWRPPGNRPLSDAEIQACLPFIHRLLAIVAPQRIVLLGTTAVRALTGETGTLRKLRGQFLPIQLKQTQLTVPALALPAIEQWLHNSATKQQLWSDLVKLQRAITASRK